MSHNLVKNIGIAVFICATFSLCSAAINLANDTSATIFEKIINIPAAIAISLGGGVMFYYAKQTGKLEGALIMLFGCVLFIAEVNTQFGSYAVSDSEYKQTSAAQKKEDEQMAFKQQKLAIYKNVNIDVNSAIAKKAELEAKIAEKKDSASLCKKKEPTCRKKAIIGTDSLKAQIKGIESQIELTHQKESVLTDAEKTLEISNKNDWAKYHPHFVSTARVIYDNPKKAEDAKNLIRLIQSFAVVLLSYIGLRMAYYNHDGKNKPINNSTPPKNKKIWFKKDLESELNNKNNETQFTNQSANNNEVIAQKTGTDDYVPVPLQQHGKATVIHFPVTVTAPKKTVSLQKRNRYSNGNDEPTSTRQRGIVTERNIVTEIKAKCAYCNDEFVTTNLKKRFCCDAHRIANHRSKNPDSLKGLGK
jgi:hypothetical protein